MRLVILVFTLLYIFPPLVSAQTCGRWNRQTGTCTIAGGLQCSQDPDTCCPTVRDCGTFNASYSTINPTCNSGAGVDTALGCIPTNPQAFAERFFPWAIGLAGGVAFLLVLLGAFQYITASGKPEQMQKAQETIISALTGLVVIIFSVVLLRIIGVDILGLPSFQ